MSEKEPTTERMLNDAEATPMPWAEALARLEHPEGEVTHWLSTVRPDGRPHVVPVGAAWLDGAMYFTTGQGTRKEKNLAQNPLCVIAFANRGFDLMVEGVAARVTDEATLERLAEKYNANGWPATVREGAFDAPFSAPTTGPAPYNVYKVTPSVVFGLGTTEETYEHPTRWRFDR